MNISLNWLKELIDIDLSPDELAAVLTRVGLAVEGIHPHGDDLILDIDLTSNRPDCLSHLGVAREVAAITRAETRPPVGSVRFNTEATTGSANLVTIDAPELCHRFTARIIRSVKIGPSPKWLVERLEAIGERSINNVADITNYVMHELGQPMHAFDLDKISGKRIVIRRARAGETIKTLDEFVRKLGDTMLAICDADKPVAVAGVMGGFESGINDSTVNVLLEVAHFNRENIRATSRTIGLASEASYRFERGVDIDNLIRASNRATELICDLAGGEAIDFVDVYPTKTITREIESKDISAAARRLTGLNVDTQDCRSILDSLGIRSEGKITSIYTVPTWRHDLAIEEDLIEEVVRHAGYDKIAIELPPAFGAGEYQPTESRKRRLRRVLVDMGFDEAISYSFIDAKFDEVFAPIPGLIAENAPESFVTLRDSVIAGVVRMRPTLLPGLLEAVRLNFNHQRRDLKLFEIGKIFAGSFGADGLPIEKEALTMVVTGREVFEGLVSSDRELDFYDAKGSIETALNAVGVAGASFTPADILHLRRGQAAEIGIKGETVGYIGRLSNDIATSYKFKQPVFVAEIHLGLVLSNEVDPVLYHPVPKYPGIVRDISFLTKRTMQFGDIQNAIRDQDFELCRSVMFADVYEGKGLAGDERSITVRILYQSDERTLVEDEVDAVHQEILSGVESRLGIRPRI